MQTISMADAFEDIVDAYDSILKAEIKTGGLLENVKTIVRGDRTRPNPTPPSIWIFPQTGLNNQTMSIKEDWELPVQLVAIVKDTDPIQGYYNSFKLAANARSAILKNRKLGVECVRDTVSKSFNATQAPNNRKNLYAHFALLNTHFNVLEK